MKEQSLSTAKSPAFINTVVEPWSKAKISDPQVNIMQAEKFVDFQQLIDEKDEEIDSLRKQLQDKEQLLAEVETTVVSLKEKLMEVHNYLVYKRERSKRQSINLYGCWW